MTRTVTAGRTRFLLREQGNGDGVPVLLLHGVPETGLCWRDVQPVLADGRRVLAPDLPGLGGSSFPGPYDAGTLAGELAALLASETSGPVDVVGHDWGGILALALAARRPDLVRRLAVLNAPYRRQPRPWQAVHVPVLALPALPELLLSTAGARVVDLLLNAGWKAPGGIDDERRAAYRAAYTAPAAQQAMLGYYRAAARPRAGALLPGSALTQAVGTVDVQGALVLWGALDPALPLAVGRAAATDLGPSTQMVVVPRAGHFVVEEAPDVVREALLEHLA